ncbi:hypothetical protein C8Q72DRAFT_475640 [Fomitopsis betulina]|nr:hypothetical protein C8Q72DRAFT_475640 [Fomitopsis betulina]
MSTSLQEQLASLRACIKERPPHHAGTLTLSPPNNTLFYGKDKNARRIDFIQTTDEELRHLAESCDVATFGVKNENVHDESYRKAGKLNTEHFSVGLDLIGTGLLDVIQTEFLEVYKDTPPIRAERYNLNVYGPGSFFKSHQDTPRGADMFGSLVIVYPTPHEGGQLVFRHEGKEWIFDSARITAEQREPSLAYVAFYSDVEHEVLEVKSGYRVTVTYNLHFAESSATITPSIHPHTFAPTLKAALQRLLDDPSFLPRGGHLGFCLSHRYPC